MSTIDNKVPSKKCIVCGSEYFKTINKTMKHWKARKYCCTKCYWESKKGIVPKQISNFGRVAWNFGKEGLKGKDSPKYNRIDSVCLECGKAVIRKKYLANKKHFCSVACNRFYKTKNAITSENKRLRTGSDWKIWREAVFVRDNYTCVLCGERGGELHPDHIKKFADYPDLRFDTNNGRTLCKRCHLKTDTWGNRKKKVGLTF